MKERKRLTTKERKLILGIPDSAEPVSPIFGSHDVVILSEALKLARQGINPDVYMHPVQARAQFVKIVAKIVEACK